MKFNRYVDISTSKTTGGDSTTDISQIYDLNVVNAMVTRGAGHVYLIKRVIKTSLRAPNSSVHNPAAGASVSKTEEVLHCQPLNRDTRYEGLFKEYINTLKPPYLEKFYEYVESFVLRFNKDLVSSTNFIVKVQLATQKAPKRLLHLRNQNVTTTQQLRDGDDRIRKKDTYVGNNFEVND